MNNCIAPIPKPYNEPIKHYLPHSVEIKALKKELGRQSETIIQIPVVINGESIHTTDQNNVACPHNHEHILAVFSNAGQKEVDLAIESALDARLEWEAMPWQERASIFLKAADLISKKYTYQLNAATMLGQSKNVYQAEIDATCELVDFLRFNVKFMEDIYSQQPESAKGEWNRTEYRGLEGFVFAVTPFNFTAIAGNLCCAPAMMGNTIVWKPSSTAVLSGYYLMEVLKEAGLPDGVINFIPGKGSVIGDIVLNHKALAGIHFTGSTEVFKTLWKTMGNNIDIYHSYPRMVGETGGKNYIFMHPSAKMKPVVTAAIRGAFEYQGQKCSACSRMYVPQSRWKEFEEQIIAGTESIKTGSVMEFKNFMNAMIDEPAFYQAHGFIERAKASDQARIIAGGTFNKSKGYFIDPTIIVTENPNYETMTTEIFAPILTVYIYDDDNLDQTLEIVNKTSTYALTGAIFAMDRLVVNTLTDRLSQSAGNFYINDKPTGAVVGRQPFGGGRASGTNDKAGSLLNLLKWTSARTIKETFNPPEDYSFISAF